MIFAFFLVHRNESKVRASADYGKFAAVRRGMTPGEVAALLGSPSCVQSALQLERNEGPLCVPYLEQSSDGLVMVYLQGDFIGRVHFDDAGKEAQLEAFVPPGDKVVPGP